jgi:hypothetical protein
LSPVSKPPCLERKDFEGALQRIADARPLLLGTDAKHLYDIFDSKIFGRPLQGDEFSGVTTDSPRAQSKVRVQNKSARRLFVLFRGASRADLAIPPQLSASVSLRPREYVV